MRNTRLCAYDKTGASQCRTPSIPYLSSFTADPLTSLSRAYSASNFDIVRHLQRNWKDIIQMPGSEHIISLSAIDSTVYGAVLAISACHLRSTSSEIVQHRIAEYSYLSLAIRHYQKALKVPRSTLSQTEVEVLLISAILLNVLAFSQLDISDGSGHSITSWLYNSNDGLQGWLVMQAGLKPLLISAASQLSETRSTLGQTIFGSDGKKWPTPNFDLDLSGLPDAWIEVFNLTDSWCADAFGQPIAILRELRLVEPRSANLCRNLLFLWKMSVQFRGLLCQRDKRAVWLFGYWFGLLCRYQGAWWCGKCSRKNYFAICTFLDQLQLAQQPGSEGDMWGKMMNELKLAPVVGFELASWMLTTSYAIEHTSLDLSE
jgi:hypothetical protein